MSDSGVPLEKIADLCGHSSTAVTEEVYRHQLKPVITAGAEAIDAVFAQSEDGRTEAAAQRSRSKSVSVV